MHDQQVRWAGRAAVAGAALGTLLTPLHAMARHGTADGRGDLEMPLTRAWSEPLSEAVRPLLTWADADTVYLSYGKGWLVVFGAVTACAFAQRRQRRPVGLESWGWRLALPAYVLMTLAVLVSYWTPQWMDMAFVALGIPGLLLGLAGSTVLGIALLRRSSVPRAAAWLLALSVPLAIALAQAVSFGGITLPIVIAWALVGRHLSRGEAATGPSLARRRPGPAVLPAP